MNLRKSTIALIVGLLIVANLLGQKDIVGYVVDENGQPLVGATLAVYHNNVLTRGYATDQFGEFIISLTESDRVVVRYLGFEQAEINYPTIADDNWIILKENQIYLDEVVVVSIKGNRYSHTTSCGRGYYGTRCGRVIKQEKDSILEEAHFQSMYFYPNPTKDFIRIALDEDRNGHIEIIGANGALLSQQEFFGRQVDLDLRSYPSGIYYLRHIGDQEDYLVGEVIKVD